MLRRNGSFGTPNCFPLVLNAFEKVSNALTQSGARTLILAGGVAANKYIKERLTKLLKNEHGGVPLLTPPKGLTGDNALMIALAGIYRAQSGEYEKEENLQAHANLTLY